MKKTHLLPPPASYSRASRHGGGAATRGGAEPADVGAAGTAVHAMGLRRTRPRRLARASGDETSRGGALGSHMQIELAEEGSSAGGAPAAGPEVPHRATTA